MFASFQQEHGRPMVIGHRGYVESGQSRLLENTLLAFEQAWKNGAEGVEFDIHLTKDDYLVCYHDFTLEKVGNDQKIQNITLEEIKEFKLPERQEIPILEEIFDSFANSLYFNIEIKVPESVYPVMDLIEERGLKERCLISSFHPTAIEVVTGAGKGFHAALLYYYPWGKIEKAKALKIRTVNPFYGQVSFKLTSLARIFMNHHLDLAMKYGFTVNPYSVNNAKDALALAKKGVSGIITDNTPLLSQLFTSRI